MEPLKSYKTKLQTPNCAENGHLNTKFRCPICNSVTLLGDSQLKTKIISLAGSFAGKSGRGSAKTRNKSHYQRIAKIRWQKNITSSQSQKSTSLKMRQPK